LTDSTGSAAPRVLTAGPAIRRVVIVVRGDIGLFNYIKGRCSGREGVEVVVDRRRYEQRRRSQRRLPERRRAERRRRFPADLMLRSVGWVEVWLPEE
jgi:hypothetical protein